MVLRAYLYTIGLGAYFAIHILETAFEMHDSFPWAIILPYWVAHCIPGIVLLHGRKAAKEGGQWWPLPVIGTNFLIRSLPPPSPCLAPLTPNFFTFICHSLNINHTWGRPPIPERIIFWKKLQPVFEPPSPSQWPPCTVVQPVC